MDDEQLNEKKIIDARSERTKTDARSERTKTDARSERTRTTETDEQSNIEHSLSKNSLRLLKVRKIQKIKKPHFKRADAHKFKRIDSNWRRPRGLQGKQRKQVRAKGLIVKVGFGSPKEVKGLHPSGFEDVLVFNLDALDKINPKIQAIRIGRVVGTKKKIAIETKAKALGIKVLNAIER